jgi:protein translocase SecG subunit
MISVLVGIVVALMFILSILLSVLILFQDNKGGLTGALGTAGAESALGGRATERISRMTGYFVAAFMILCLVVAVLKNQQKVVLPGKSLEPAPIQGEMAPQKGEAETPAPQSEK